MTDIPGYIEEIIKKHMIQLQAQEEYRLRSSKYLGMETLESKLMRFESWAEFLGNEITIIQKVRIDEEYFFVDIKVDSLVGNLINSVICDNHNDK